MRVFLTGGTGLVGTRLVKRLVERGDEVVVLTRRPGAARELLGPAVTAVEGDPAQSGEWMTKATACDGVINLAGENLFARRWDGPFKQVLVDSRVKSTQNVARALAQAPRRADGTSKVLVSASAVGIYGPHGDEELKEDTPAGSDFLAKLCVEWEQATQPAAAAGVRTVIVRVGVVLDKNGGALAKLLTPFKLGMGGAVGGGKQWMSWIHHHDLGSLFLLALDDSRASGPLNGTAPNPVTNADFSKALGRVMHRPAFMPTPAFALRLALGEVADVVATGQRVLPNGPIALGSKYSFPLIDAALADIIR
jgi:uncharacterized protein (TIGR01777 family)